MVLTNRFARALAFAEQLHRAQTRKGNDVPYVAHLMAVCATTLEWGGDEGVAIAALLHDAVEDQGGSATAALIRQNFGDRVAEIVLACTDAGEDERESTTWRERKMRHVEKLRDADADVALVIAADKLHNAAALVRDVQRYGPSTLHRFNAGPEEIVCYLRSVADAIDGRGSAPVGELRERVSALEALLGLQVAQ